ncbi:hypothetical protein [Oceanicoccus sagamiensis]|uniref:hypothetical protein n=1 Tax=Oceanicoccus sagamiensis TaxID=716816 RepID=UPI0012F512A1|nr:hypothetical protein [Oceanicoccus sagamiensis]
MTIVKRLSALVLLAVLSTLVVAEPTVYLGEPKVYVKKGDTFSLDLAMSDFPLSEGGA